jgi:hypothetical protein
MHRYREAGSRGPARACAVRPSARDGRTIERPVRSRLRHAATALPLLLTAAGPLFAQAPGAGSSVAVPYYTPDHFMQGLHRHATAPAAKAFAERAATLAPALERLCMSSGPAMSVRPPPPASASAPAAAALAAGAVPPALGDARTRWTTTMQAWERLAAVAVGPLIERRSLRTLDFTPSRPSLIERAVQAQPKGAAAMEKIGAPAKGLPALEWLLWTQPVVAGSPACRYAVEVAADLARESASLASAFEATAARDWEAAASSTAMAEAINQWLGGLERLRWQDIERPLQAAQDGDPGRNTPQFPRAASGRSAQSWSAQWEALRALAAQPPASPAPPGEGLVTIETYLRGRGLNAQADALRRAVLAVDPALQDLSPAAPERLVTAARALAELERVLEQQVAPALEVSIGFSDADGD